MATSESDRRAGIRSRLAELLAATGPLDIAEAALCIAAEEYPGLEIDRETERIRLIAAEGSSRAAADSNPFARLDALRVLVFEELGFRGNLDEYDDPRNSYLNEVLDRRLGIPLTLSIIYTEVAQAAGFEVRGVGLPGHFVVSTGYAGRTILIDPFHGGRVITEEDCHRLVARSTGRASMFRREQLDGTPRRAMLGRLLLNLKHVFLTGGDYARALSVVERLLLVWPDDSTEIRDMGFLKAHLGRPGAAITDLETYLSLSPGAPDRESVKGRLAWLRRKLSEIN